MSDTEDAPQQIRGTTAGSVGSVPLMILLDEYKKTQDIRWLGMLDESKTYRAATREDSVAWRIAHERVHQIEHNTMETKTLVLDKRLDTLNHERQQINSERDSLATKDLLQGQSNTLRALIDSVEKTEAARINSIEKQIATFNGQLKLLGFVLTVLMFAISVGVRFLGN